MTRGALVTSLLVLVLGCVPNVVRADSLSCASHAVHGDDEAPESQPRREERHDEAHPHQHREHHHGDDDDESVNPLGYAVAMLVLAPWFLPAAVLNELYPDYDDLPHRPYADEAPNEAPPEPRIYELRAHLGAGARNPHLMSGTFGAQIDFSIPVALNADYRVLTEADGGGRSWAGLGSFEVLYRFADSPILSFHSGLGYMQWVDPRVGHGIELSYGFDAYPLRPISFGSRVSLGVAGQAGVVQWRSYLGVLIERYEIQISYDYLTIGGVQLGGAGISLQAYL